MHGGNPQEYVKKFGFKPKNIIDFSTNINPFGVPPILKVKWHEFIKDISLYPSCEGEYVIEFYREKFDISQDNIVVGNGSVELIYLSPSALNIQTIAVIEPSFYDYKRAFEVAGCKIHHIYLKEDNEFEMDYERDVVAYMKDVDAVMFGNPNNPTGTMIKKEKILNLAKQFNNKWFLVDEAFIQFSDKFEQDSLLFERTHNVIVFHSLTKFYALAGLRIGAVIASKDVADRFKKVKPPWSVNAIAENVTRALIQCDEYEKSTLRFIKLERERIKNTFHKTDTIKLFGTHANFFLAKLNKKGKFDDFLIYMFKNGIYLRDCRNFNGLRGDFFRFAILDREKNDKMIDLVLAYE